jgi:hypothetical protein
VLKRALFIVSLLWVCLAPAEDTHQVQLAGRSVALHLVRADTLAAVPWPAEDVVLKQTPAVIGADQNIYLLLQANGVAPDSEAFALIYDLNPKIKDVGLLSSTTQVQLPAVVGGPQLQALFQSGVVTQLVVDPELRHDLSDSIARLKAFAPEVNGLGFPPESQQQIQSLIQWFGEIETRFKRRTDPPLSHTTLLQMRDEAMLLQSLLMQAKTSHEQIKPSGVAQLSAIYDDIMLEMRQYGQTLADATPKAESSYEVRVNIKGANENYVSGLRVYYIFNGLFPPPPEQPPVTSLGFRNLGSGQSENLLQKNYRVWAAKDGDAIHPVTPPYLLRIDGAAASPLTVDLSLTSGSHP